MTSRDRDTTGEYVFRRRADGAVQVRVYLHGAERDLQQAGPAAPPRAYSPSAIVDGDNLALAGDLLLDLTGSLAIAEQAGERLARKLAATFAARASIDGLTIAREAIWRWLRWALTHPAAPVAERPLVRQRRRDLPPPYLGGGHWWWNSHREVAESNPLRWECLTVATPGDAENLAGRRFWRVN